MVNNLSWGNFPTPEGQEERNQIPFLENEEKQEFSGGMQDESSSEKPQWGNFLTTETYQGEEDPTEGEGPFDDFMRNIVSNSSRLGEQYFGRAGNIEKVSKDILSHFPLAGGLLGYGLHKLMGQERWETFIKGKPGQDQIFPTSQQLKELSENVSQGYTKPKTGGEEHFQKYIEDIGSTIMPGKGFDWKSAAVNNLGIPVAANVVGDIIENLGYGKDKGTIGKLGTWQFLSLLGNVNASKFAAVLTNQGRNGIPQNNNFNIPRMTNKLDNIDRKLLSVDPRSALARQALANLRNDIANGQMSTRSLMTSYDGINALKRDRGLFELGRSDRNFARKEIDNVLHAVRDEIMDSAGSYPQALEDWRNGIQAWAVIHQSKAITNTIDQWARGPYAKVISGPAAALFGVTAYGGLKAPIVSLPISGAVPLAYKTGQIAYRVAKDERLAKYYWNAVLSAQQENAPAFIKNYLELNKGLEKSSSSSKKNKKKS